MKENVSAVEILVDRMEISSDEVVELIKDLIVSGELNGTLTEDEKRFFKSDVKLSDAPTIEREEPPPSFLSFNARPAIAVTILGFIVLGSGFVVNSFAIDEAEQSFATILIFLGLMIALSGCYCISQRQTPA